VNIYVAHYRCGKISSVLKMCRCGKLASNNECPRVVWHWVALLQLLWWFGQNLQCRGLIYKTS